MSKTSRLHCPYRGCYIALFLFTTSGLLIPAIINLWLYSRDPSEEHVEIRDYPLPTAQPLKEMLITTESEVPAPKDETCLYHTCFQVYKCGYNEEGRISVYIYPPVKYVDEHGVPVTLPFSKEFSELIQAIAQSVYYTTDPNQACLFLPPVDLLNQNNIRLEQAAKILASLPHWGDGANHLLFNMLPGSVPDFNTTLDVHTGKAVLAGGGFDSWSYRRTYDVSVPIYNPMVASVTLPYKSVHDSRTWHLVSTQMGLHKDYLAELKLLTDQSPNEFLLLDRCTREFNYTVRCGQGEADSNEFEYMPLLQESDFCLVVRGSRLGQPMLYDAMKAGCIPVVVADTYILPFSEVLDWPRALVRVSERNLAKVLDIVKAVSRERMVEMRKQVEFYFNNYISTMEAITLTTLQIINDRVYPYAATKFEEWNVRPDENLVQPPLFLPLVPPKMMGFTAVILTYNRLLNLFKVIEHVAKAPSLAKVLVVWNNQKVVPPNASEWPRINKPLKVVQTRYNKLSNRFYPYDEIETEAILALDDDIVMLTTDELEFGYQVWREFPDRLVGFPSRLHLWDNQTWRYESEWTSSISIVLTGAAFYHKYYSYLYTNALPKQIKTWVDEHMNCEDIAMNFLIANVTGQAPIKVAPRQKFKCVGGPDCHASEGLSADLKYMEERSECINKFEQIYKSMPLKTVEFRADPVLYKENLPENLLLHKDLGSL